jgi:hypothetical protein
MKYLAIILALALTGCASTDYDSYAKAQGEIARAKSDADTARYTALSEIAKTGTESAKIAAVMALALGSGSTTQATQQVQAPQASQALQWAQVLVPSITNIAGLHYASKASTSAAESSARVAESTNAAFLGMAGKIQAPVVAAAVMPQANVTTTTTTTTTDNHASSVSTDSHAVATTNANPTTTTTALSGTGTLGSGAYSTAANPVTTTTTTNPATTGTVCGVSVAGVVNCLP